MVFDCETGDTFTLTYSATAPVSDLIFNTGNEYKLYLVGTIGAASAVPVPAAVWLFGSGLISLVGFARRKKA